MSVECQVNVKSQSELDIGGCETCLSNSSVEAKPVMHSNSPEYQIEIPKLQNVMK